MADVRISAPPGVPQIVTTVELDAPRPRTRLDGHADARGAGGRTTVRSNSIFQAVEDRDAMVQAGMEKGVTEGTQRLEGLLEKLKKGEGEASRAT